MNSMSKICSKCKETKSVSYFYRRADSKDGYAHECKSCNNERRQVSHKKYFDNHVLSSTGKKICTGCNENKMYEEFALDKWAKDGYNIYCKICTREKCTEYYEDNVDKRLRYFKEYRETHVEEMAQHKLKNRKENPERYRTYRQKRRVNLKIEMTKEDIHLSTEWRKLIKNDPCYYCGLHKEVMHDDHYVPLAQGGTDHYWNIVRSCADCNLRKGVKHGDVFLRLT